MKLLKKISQYRRDFDAIYKCEFCGAEETVNDCYDDRNFHDTVSPKWTCKKCGKSTISENGKIDFVSTKYSEYEFI